MTRMKKSPEGCRRKALRVSRKWKFRGSVFFQKNGVITQAKQSPHTRLVLSDGMEILWAGGMDWSDIMMMCFAEEKRICMSIFLPRFLPILASHSFIAEAERGMLSPLLSPKWNVILKLF